MAAPHRPPNATAADLQAVGESSRTEIIGGELVEKAMPSMAHAAAQLAVAQVIGPRFNRRPGGRWPGGWWLGTEAHVQYATHEIYCHDLVGWRRDRVPERPTGWPIATLPDWVCENLSPKHEKRDLVDKMRTLHANRVPHYWILNPEEKILVVHRSDTQGYVVLLAAATGETVRAEPFDAIELRVGVLFGDDDEDE
jgi:Uma2 family endonuclease